MTVVDGSSRTSSFFIMIIGCGVFAKVIPIAHIVADSLQETNIWFCGGKFDKVSTIGAHEGKHRPDTAHPPVVKEDAAAHGAARSVKIKVGEHIVETVGAIDENEIETGIGSREVRGGAVGAFFDETERGVPQVFDGLLVSQLRQRGDVR